MLIAKRCADALLNNAQSPGSDEIMILKGT